MSEHQYTPAPVFAIDATYTQAACRCGWVEKGIAYRTSREAKQAWNNHVAIGGGSQEQEG